MALSSGPKLGLINNANIGQTYVDQFRQFLQAIDQLVQMSVLSSTVATPPSTPNNGDAYLLTPTPSGAWANHQGQIAVWDTQVTTSGTNTQVPAWVFYTPKPGWVLWNVATTALLVFNGGITWSQIGGSTGTIQTNTITNATSNTPVTVTQTGGGVVSLAITGNGTDGVSLLGFATYPVQATVGSTGFATPLPTAPSGYLELFINGTTQVVPFYAKA